MTTPAYLVWLDGTPEAPEVPLAAEEAVERFQQAIAEDEEPEIRLMSEQELAWAGVTSDDENGDGNEWPASRPPAPRP